MILILIKFFELLLRISPSIINSLRSYIKINNIKSVSSDFQTPRSWLKKLGCASFFQPTSRCLEIGGNTLPRVWSITYSFIHPPRVNYKLTQYDQLPVGSFENSTSEGCVKTAEKYYAGRQSSLLQLQIVSTCPERVRIEPVCRNLQKGDKENKINQ